MAISYNKLWKVLIDKGMNKTDLRIASKISTSTLAKLTKQEPVTLEVLERICNALDCNIGDVVKFVNDDNTKGKKGWNRLLDSDDGDCISMWKSENNNYVY